MSDPRERPQSEAEIFVRMAHSVTDLERLAAALRQVRAERDDYRNRLDAKLTDALKWMCRALEAEEQAASLRAANAALRQFVKDTSPTKHAAWCRGDYDGTCLKCSYERALASSAPEDLEDPASHR